MKIKLDNELFRRKEFEIQLDELLGLIINQRYELVFDDDEFFSDDNEWLKKSRDGYVDIVMRAFQTTVRNSSKNDIIIGTTNDLTQNVYSIADGLTLLKEPVRIILENAHYDSQFVLGLTNKFKKRSKKISRFIREGWLVFENSGGKNNVINQITHLLSKFNECQLENAEYLKGLVLVDSDKKHKNDEDAERLSALQKITEVCNQLGLECHILEKREMENYLPFEFISDIQELDEDSLEKLESLNPEERDYFDMEELSTKEYKTKQNFPFLFNSDKLTRDLMLGNCEHQHNPNELEYIIDRINSLL